MTVSCSIAFFVNIFQSRHRPTREVFATIFSNTADGIHARPVFAPVSTQSNESTVRNSTIFSFVFFNIFYSYCVMNIFCNFRSNVDNTQGEHQLFRTIMFRGFSVFNEVCREVNVSTKLTGEFKSMNNAFEHRIAPIVANLAQFHRTFRNASPIRTIVIQRMRKFHPFVFRRFHFT